MASTIPEDYKQILEGIEHGFPVEELGDDSWWIVLLSVAVGAGHTHIAPSLYKYLLQQKDERDQPLYPTPASRQALMQRIREVLMKIVPLAGVVKPLDAVIEIDAITAPEDKDYSFSRKDWQCNEEYLARGERWLGKLYRGNLKAIDETLASQKDFGWVSRNITYGLYLSDHTILNEVETELVVLSSIMVQNMARETGWHLRGCRRIGISVEALTKVYDCIKHVADYCGVALDRVPHVSDIEHEV